MKADPEAAGRPAGRVERALAPVLAGLLFALESLLLAGSRMDDPYIFARYARNLWRHGDIVWNAGGPRIEGFSSWLWLGVNALGIRIMSDPVVFARTVGLLLGAVLIFDFTRELYRHAASRAAALGATAVAVGSPGLAYYAGCGMDHIAWALVTWWYVRWVGRDGALSGRHFLVAALGLLVRPEGFLLFVPALAVLCSDRLTRGRPLRGAALARALGPGAAALVLLLLSRRLLFGAWLPNAAAAKHAGGSLLLRLSDGAVYLGPGLALYAAVPIALAAIAWGRSGRDAGEASEAGVPERILVGSAALIVALCGFILLAGGDDISAFGWTRLLSPAIVPACYVLFWSFERLAASPGKALRIAAIVLVVLGCRVTSAKDLLKDATGATNLSGPSDVLMAWQSAFRPLPPDPLAAYLKAEVPPGETIAIPWAGVIPFQSDLPTIDMLGLNDPHISRTPTSVADDATARYDHDYLLRRLPFYLCDNFIVRGPIEEFRRLDDAQLRLLGAYRGGQRALLTDPRLAEHYEVDAAAPVAGTCFRRLDSAGGGRRGPEGGRHPDPGGER